MGFPCRSDNVPESAGCSTVVASRIANAPNTTVRLSYHVANSMVARVDTSEIIFGILFGALDFTVRNRAREDRTAPGRCRELPQERNYLRLQVAFPKRILTLQRGNRMDGMRAPAGNTHFGKAEESHFAFCDQIASTAPL